MWTGIAFGLILLLAAVGVLALLPARQDLWRVIPRDRQVGIILGAGCLIWSVMLVSPLLEGPLARLQIFLWPLAIAIGIASYFSLDYLFTRALGGFLILMANQVMHDAFVSQASMRWLLALCCYILGISGILMISSPFRFRDLLHKATETAAWRRGLASFLVVSGLIAVAISAISYT